MLVSLYRKILPYAFRKSIYDFFLGEVVFFFRYLPIIAKSKCLYWFGFLFPKNEMNNAYAFIGKHGITSYPHEYSLPYRTREVSVHQDVEQKLPYVIHNGHRLYFPDFYTEEKIKKDYRALLTEQDPKSAHRYVNSYTELTSKTLLDVGAAEGIFSLDTIEYTNHVILFECMEYWQAPLRATFSKWPDKVTLVKKYVGDTTANDFVAIDDFLPSNNRQNLFIKMDIEGAERQALQGAQDTLQQGTNVQVAICTYHRVGDPEYIDKYLLHAGFVTEFSEGFLFWSKRLSKAIIRGKK